MSDTGRDRRRVLDVVKPDERSGGRGERYSAKTRIAATGVGKAMNEWMIEWDTA